MPNYPASSKWVTTVGGTALKGDTAETSDATTNEQVGDSRPWCMMHSQINSTGCSIRMVWDITHIRWGLQRHPLSPKLAA